MAHNITVQSVKLVSLSPTSNALAPLLHDLKQLDAPDFERVLVACIAICRGTAEVSGADSSWKEAAEHLAHARCAVAHRSGN